MYVLSVDYFFLSFRFKSGRLSGLITNSEVENKGKMIHSDFYREK